MTRQQRDAELERIIDNLIEHGRDIERGRLRYMQTRIERRKELRERLLALLDQWGGGGE